MYGDVGYRWRDGHVPDDFFGSVGTFLSWKFLSATFGYRFTEGLSGPDIGDPGFTFSRVKEISHNLEGSLGITDGGGRYYQVFYAHTIEGRNTGSEIPAPQVLERSHPLHKSEIGKMRRQVERFESRESR